MSKRRRKNQNNRHPKSKDAKQALPRPSVSPQALIVRIGMPFSRGGANLVLRVRKLPSWAILLMLLLVSLSSFFYNFGKAMEMAKAVMKVVNNLYEYVAKEIKIDSLASHDRASQENHDRLIQTLQTRKQEAQLE